ncbi:MAG: restriction endonuclease, partial [Clostridia bacterium]|nr:restriction endonuclease [Clostridia bacterium]
KNLRENMSFRPFQFKKLIEETWEESTLREELEPTIFMFTIFEELPGGKPGHRNCVFRGVKFWNMPAEDLEEVRVVWERTVQTIRDGVQLIPDGKRVRNNLPKQRENRVAHVRPHAQNKEDTYPLPDGREMTKQSFWLNNSYIADILSDVLE